MEKREFSGLPVNCENLNHCFGQLREKLALKYHIIIKSMMSGQIGHFCSPVSHSSSSQIEEALH